MNLLFIGEKSDHTFKHNSQQVAIFPLKMLHMAKGYAKQKCSEVELKYSTDMWNMHSKFSTFVNNMYNNSDLHHELESTTSKS